MNAIFCLIANLLRHAGAKGALTAQLFTECIIHTLKPTCAEQIEFIFFSKDKKPLYLFVSKYVSACNHRKSSLICV